jgi:hypothetical protein
VVVARLFLPPWAPGYAEHARAIEALKAEF